MLPAFALLSGCVDHNLPGNIAQPVAFKVVVENVSTPGLIPAMRANGTVPLSPAVFPVYATGNPMFMLGDKADAGTELIAEDGEIDEKLNMVKNAPTITASGAFDSPGGPDMGPAIFAGESSTFMITAKPGDKLQFETMFVQSNDWFISFKEGGLPLFNGNTPIVGNMTANLEIYDAGTEADTAPGTGDFQKPIQTPTATNFGPPDAVTTITVAQTRHTQFTIPATGKVIQVTITPQ